MSGFHIPKWLEVIIAIASLPRTIASKVKDAVTKSDTVRVRK